MRTAEEKLALIHERLKEGKHMGILRGLSYTRLANFCSDLLDEVFAEKEKENDQEEGN